MSSKELPEGWSWVKHSDIAEINPKLPFDTMDEDLEVSFLPMKAVQEVSGKFSLEETRQYQKVKKGYTPFINGDLIFAKITPCMENGKVALLNNLKNGIGFGSTEFHVSRLTDLTNKKYFFYYVVQESFRREARRNMTGSAGQLRVPTSYFKDVLIPLCPLPEQHQIVARLEELFSDLDDGITSLKKAQEQLTTYRQAVLKYAFEGKLTAEWRKQRHPESAETLLEQIKTEREQQCQSRLNEWQQTCEQATAAGKKKPPKPKKPKDLPPLTEAELAELPELPEGWCWVKLGNLTHIIQIGPFGTQLHKSDYIENGVPVINPMHINDLRITPNKAFSITNEKFEELAHYGLQKNDVIMGRRGEMGRCAVVTEQEQGWLCGTGSLFVRLVNILNAKFYSFVLSSQRIKSHLENSSIGTTMKNLNLTILNNIPIQVCSIDEQYQIVQEIEARLSVCDQLEQTITDSLQKAESLRQSILKHAFEGKLTEPWRKAHLDLISGEHSAAALLERIQAEKEKLKTEKNAKQMKLL